MKLSTSDHGWSEEELLGIVEYVDEAEVGEKEEEKEGEEAKNEGEEKGRDGRGVVQEGEEELDQGVLHLLQVGRQQHVQVHPLAHHPQKNAHRD